MRFGDYVVYVDESGDHGLQHINPEFPVFELEYRRILDTTRVKGLAQTLDFRIANKQVNSSGLQLADMIARPIVLKVMRPHQANRARDLIDLKLARSATGSLSGYGLKVYP